MEITQTSIIFFALALFWFLRGVRRRSWDPFAPVRLYGAVWFAAIGVTTLYWSELQMRWTFWSWFCVLGSVGSFMAGASLANLRKPQKTESVRFTIRTELNPKRFMTAVSVLYSVSLAGYFWRVASIGVIPAFAMNVEEARWAFYNIESGTTTDRMTANLAFLFSGVVIACSLFFFVTEPKSREKPRKASLIFGFLLGSALMLLILTTFRGVLFTPLVVTSVFYHYVRRRFRLWTLVVVTMLIAMLGLGVVVYRHLSSPGYALEFTHSLAEMNVAPEYALLAEPYANIALSMDNIVQLFEQSRSWTFGALTFRPVWTLLGLKGIFLEDATLPFLPAYGFNTATYLLPFYLDFGVPGMLLFPFFFGWVSGTVYNRMLLEKKISSVVVYSFVVMLILFSVIDNLFVFARFWIELGAIYMTLRYSGDGTAGLLLQPLSPKNAKSFLRSRLKCA